jgi:hypothetical protein
MISPLDNKMDRAESVFRLIHDSLTKQDFIDAFKVVLDQINELKNYNEEELVKFKDKWQELCDEMREANTEDMESQRSDLSLEVERNIDKAIEMLQEKIDLHMETIRDGKDGRDGRDGQDGRDGRDGTDGVDGSPDTGDDIILKINESEFLIDRSRIEGIEDIEARIEAAGSKGGGVRIGWGAHPIRILDENTVIEKVARTIKFAGAGVSAARNAEGVVVVTISGGASSSLTVIDATGTIDDSNTSFTFDSEPTLVNVNGAFYKHGGGVTISGTSVTTDFPVGTGGAIYGIA